MRASLWPCICLFASLVWTSLPATTVEVRFEGVVLLGFGEIEAGDAFSGRIVYDNTVAGFPGPSGTLHDAISTLEVTVGGFAYSLDGPTGRVLVENDSGVPASDNIGFSSIPSGMTGPSMLGFPPEDVFVTMAGGDPSLWPTSNLIDVPTTYSLADFSSNSFFFFFTAGAVLGTLTRLDAAPAGGGGDSDGDGVPDADDECPASDLGPTVVIGGCDTGVENDVLETGCSIADLVAGIAAGAGNKGEFVSGVATLAAGLADDGVIEESDIGDLVACAAAGP
jgi:hypothetical protein